jgi:hypothetical protein
MKRFARLCVGSSLIGFGGAASARFAVAFLSLHRAHLSSEIALSIGIALLAASVGSILMLTLIDKSENLRGSVARGSS